MVAVMAAGTELEVGVVALMAFGVIVLVLFSRALDGGGRKRAVRRNSALTSAPHAHRPRHIGARRPRSSGISNADRLLQLERLAAKGHITAEEFERTKVELQGRRSA